MPADVPISGLPAAGSVTGPDLFAVVQGGVTKQGTVSMILNALSGASAVSAVALADTVPAVQAGVTKKATVQQIFDALAFLAAQGGIASGDLIPITQAGVTKKMTYTELYTQILGGIPTATTGARGFMSAADKTILNAADSSGASILTKFSANGGLKLGGLQVCADTSGAVIRHLALIPVFVTLVGGATSETFTRAIGGYGFTSTPDLALFTPNFVSLYAVPGDFTTWSTSVMTFQVRAFSGGVLPAGPFRMTALIGKIDNPPV